MSLTATAVRTWDHGTDFPTASSVQHPFSYVWTSGVAPPPPLANLPSHGDSRDCHDTCSPARINEAMSLGEGQRWKSKNPSPDLRGDRSFSSDGAGGSWAVGSHICHQVSGGGEQRDSVTLPEEKDKSWRETCWQRDLFRSSRRPFNWPGSFSSLRQPFPSVTVVW